MLNHVMKLLTINDQNTLLLQYYIDVYLHDNEP